MPPDGASARRQNCPLAMTPDFDPDPTTGPVDDQPPDAITGLTLILMGDPRAQPRARHIPGRRRPVSTADAKAQRYVLALEQAARGMVVGVGGPVRVRKAFKGKGLQVRVRWAFGSREAARWGTPHTQRPDADNLEKMTLDCLMRAGALGGDDAKVATVQKLKVWDVRGGTWLTITPIEKDGAQLGAMLANLKTPGWLKN